MKMKPSDVRLGIPPLVGTMGHAEVEYAAALVVRTCQQNSDRWQPVSLQALVAVIKADVEEKREPNFSFSTNPFFRPNFRALAKSKFGRWTGKAGESSLELTEIGIGVLERWCGS